MLIDGVRLDRYDLLAPPSAWPEWR
jgi:hypothetical protein